jgi:hypothetical protein
LLFYLFAFIALIVFVIRIPLLLVSSPPRTFARLRSFGFNKALKKISPTVSENLAARAYEPRKDVIRGLARHYAPQLGDYVAGCHFRNGGSGGRGRRAAPGFRSI